MTAPQNSRVTQADWDAVTAFHNAQVKRILAGDRTLGENRDAIEEAFARHREAAEAASKARTLSDHGRMLWRDDVEGHCPSPELCFEYGPTVRCSPCAIKQADAAGVATLHPDHTYSPQECRLKRELAASKAREAALVEALDAAADRLERAAYIMSDERLTTLSGLFFAYADQARAALTKEPDA